jgi:hypothetical protein
VSNNVIEASWDALVDAITYGLLMTGAAVGVDAAAAAAGVAPAPADAGAPAPAPADAGAVVVP